MNYRSARDAACAVAANGSDFQGRTMTVRFASDPVPRPPERPQSHEPSAAPEPRPGNSGMTIFIGGLSYQSTKESVEAFFSRCGRVQAVRIALNEDGRPRGFAHVEFDSEDAVAKAVALSGQQLDGRNIRVDVAESRSGGRPSRGGFPGSRGPPRGRGSFGGYPYGYNQPRGPYQGD